MNIDPQSLDIADRYKLLIGSIVPRPIAVVSTVSPAGAPNLAPFSFFNAIGSNPMCVMFCPANGPAGEEKDTLRNAKPVGEGGTGAFVINWAVESIIRKVVGAAEPRPYGDNEFDLVDLTELPSAVVAPPRVAESPIAFECRTMQVVRTNPGQPMGGNIVIGEVVHIVVDDDLINERFHIDQERLRAVGRMGGRSYCRTRERFELSPGTPALTAPSTFEVR
ncbi:MAG: flavin reductase family protein [Phycisphaerales bacterium]|nr:flavin reductase family protein [Phycisphaerales bacterium]